VPFSSHFELFLVRTFISPSSNFFFCSYIYLLIPEPFLPIPYLISQFSNFLLLFRTHLPVSGLFSPVPYPISSISGLSSPVPYLSSPYFWTFPSCFVSSSPHFWTLLSRSVRLFLRPGPFFFSPEFPLSLLCTPVCLFCSRFFLPCTFSIKLYSLSCRGTHDYRHHF
jgi:hypothetical protein